MIQPSYYFPNVFTLDSGPVQAVQTSKADPRVRMDSTGLWSKDATGAYVFQLDAAAGTGFFKGTLQAIGLKLPTSTGSGGIDSNKVIWTKQNGTDLGGNEVKEALLFNYEDGSHGELWVQCTPNWVGAPSGLMSYLRLISVGMALGAITLQVQDNVGLGGRLITKTLLDSGGVSDYMMRGDAVGGDLTGTLPNPTVKPSVALTGDPTAPTPATADNDTSIATTAFVKAQGYITSVNGWGAWTAFPFNATNWQNLAGGQPCQYRVNSATGEVQIRGQCQSKTAITFGFSAASKIGTLPGGAHPATSDQITMMYGTDPTIGKCIWAFDVVGNGTGDIYIFAEMTGRAPGLGTGVTVNMFMAYSTL